MARSFDIPDLTGETAPSLRQRSLRVLLATFVLSVTLHAALFATWPGWVRDREPPQVRVLDVVLLKPEPLPVAAPEPARVASETNLAAADRKQAAPPKLRADDAKGPAAQEPVQSPVLAAAEPFAVAEFTPVPPPAAAPVSRPGQKAEGATTVTPPIHRAAYLRNPPPRYPIIARRNGEQGTVTLRVLVTRDGLPASVSVEKSSGSNHLDSAALETVRTWRFVPARQGAQPVEAWVLVPIVFKLEGVS
jgi:protein TonB